MSEREHTGNGPGEGQKTGRQRSRARAAHAPRPDPQPKNSQSDQPHSDNRAESHETSPGAVVQFDFRGKAVRTVTKHDETWFVVADVCRVLGLRNPRQAISVLEDNEKGIRTMDTLGGSQEMNIVSESGM